MAKNETYKKFPSARSVPRDVQGYATDKESKTVLRFGIFLICLALLFGLLTNLSSMSSYADRQPVGLGEGEK